MSIPIYGDANDTELVTTKLRLTLRATPLEKAAWPLFRIVKARPALGGTGREILYLAAGAAGAVGKPV